MQASELRNLDVNEIKAKIDAAYQELFNLRFQWASGQLEDHNRGWGVLMRAMEGATVLRERELNGGEAEKA